MRSSAGVGTTPPNVPGAPKPTSSVMMSSTLGAPFGGTTRGGHQAFDSEAFSLITPPNFGSGGGSCFPLMVVVALGEPGTPVTCWAMPGTAAAITASAAPQSRIRFVLFMGFSPSWLEGSFGPLLVEPTQTGFPRRYAVRRTGSVEVRIEENIRRR